MPKMPKIKEGALAPFGFIFRDSLFDILYSLFQEFLLSIKLAASRASGPAEHLKPHMKISLTDGLFR
jgi:hypothetical protein